MNEHKNIITIEDEIKEFSDKPVKSSALYKKAKELESNAVPDASEASAGDVLSLDEDKKPTWAPSSGGGGKTIVLDEIPVKTVTDGEHTYSSDINSLKANVGGEEVPLYSPVYFYDVSVYDVIEESDGTWTSLQMIRAMNKVDVDDENGNEKSIAKTGETKGLIGSWWITKGTIYDTDIGAYFVSSDTTIEYREQ